MNPGLDVELGQPVKFTATLKRGGETRMAERFGRQVAEHWKVWRRHQHPAIEGIIVGQRTLANGRAEYEHEAGMVWYPGTAVRFTAYLIAFDLHRKPVLVMPVDIETTEGNDQ